MQNLTKLILNNKIVEFRKPVRQSRIHCIRKLSRDIKKLKEKKGTDEQKIKNIRKAERYVEEIFTMKKLKDDEISKFAILNERTLNDITNDVNENLEKKALARLVHHKSVAEKVQNFRETFPEWKNCLEFLLETLGEKYKHKKSMKSSKKKSKSKSITSKIEIRNDTWTVEPITWKEPTTSNDESNDKRTDDKLGNRSKLVNLERKREKSTKIDVFKEEVVDECRVEKEPSVDRADEVSNIALEELSESCSLDEESNIQGAVDPFFLTKDNVEYISVSAKENESFDRRPSKPKHHDRTEFSRNSNFKQREFKSQKYGKREFDDTRFKKREVQPKKFGKQASGRDDRHYNRREEMPVELERLHPSWEAKKKQAIQYVPFLGKKIKFDNS